MCYIQTFKSLAGLFRRTGRFESYRVTNHQRLRSACPHEESLGPKLPIEHTVKTLCIALQVVCGQDHTMFLTDDGEVYSCGLGADGQTGKTFISEIK